jgi:hypothetical protein
MPVLPSLRETIAESMEALANSQCMAMPLDSTTTLGEIKAITRAITGAETLRWCDEYEGTEQDEQCQADEQQIYDLEAQIDRISRALDDWRTAKLTRPAEFRDRLATILKD